MARSKRTRALAIPPAVKRAVWERQGGLSIFPPYMEITVEECCCHYIPRSRGGLGIEENIFGCAQRFGRNEHMWFDGQEPCSFRKEMKEIAKKHFQRSYPDWDEKKLIYRKGEEYGTTSRDGD